MLILDARHLIRVALLVIAAMAPCVSFAAGKQPARYPKQLHGFWISATQECPQDSSLYDGDIVIGIQSNLLYGYEEVSKPIHVVLISENPLTWRIETTIDIGPSGVFEKDVPRIFVLGNEQLTVISESHTEVYERCRLKKGEN